MVVGTRNSGEKLFKIVNTFIMILVCIAMLYPFLHIMSISLSNKYYVSMGNVSFFPRGFTIGAYLQILKSKSLYTAYGNTLFVVFAGTMLSVLFTSFAAYALSKQQMPGRRIFTYLITITLWLNAGMIPQFLVIQKLHLYNSLWSLILSPLISAFHVIIMRNFFQDIPDSLEESAKLDGCKDFGVLFKIVYPVSKSVLATVALWVAVTHWNAFFEPLLYLKDRNKLTIQLALREIIVSQYADAYGLAIDSNFRESEVIAESIQYGTIIVTTLPILAVYPFIQKYFVKGIMIGSVKG